MKRWSGPAVAARFGSKSGSETRDEDLAGLGVEHDARAADAAEIVDAALQLLAHDLLDADIEGELHGMAPARQHVVEGALDSRQPLVVDIGEADDMARSSEPMG